MPRAAGFADALILVIEVADLANGGRAAHVDASDFARRQANLGVVALFGQQLRSAARRGSNKDWKIQDPQIPQSQWYYTDALFCGFRVMRPLRSPTAEEKARFGPDKTQMYKEK